MQFEEKKYFYFLSPFKIISLEVIQGSGFPLSSNFNYLMMWEFEQLCSKEKPTSVNDISVAIKMHYTLRIIKPIMFGTSILRNETEH